MTLLDPGAVTIDDIRFIGATLWTDLRLEGAEAEARAHLEVGRGLADFTGAIRHHAGQSGRFTTAESARRHTCVRGPVSLSHEHGKWKILDRETRQVGRMARSWTLPHGMAIARASVQGICTRWADDGEDEESKRTLRSETWEVVGPQFFLSREQSSTMDKPRTGFAG